MKKRIRFGLLILAVFAIGSLSGQWLAEHEKNVAWAATNTSDLPLVQLQEMAEIFTIIRSNYVEDIPPDRLMENALRGMVSALDPHSSYLSQSDLTGFQRSLTNEEYGGVGIYVGQKNKWVEVISPIYGTPAFRAKMKSNDLILKIDGVSTQGMEIDKAVEKMRGKVGTILNLEILPADGGDTRKVELIREKIVTPSVISSLIEGGYGYLHITRFQDKTMENLVSNLNGMYTEYQAPLKGIILDLRNNPGGYLNAGIGVAAAFLPTGVTVVSDRGRTAKNNHVFLSQDSYYPGLENRALLQSVPMVVLVNNGSASASEIVAGALQDHRRGVVLGTRTYGKASVQTVLPLRSSQGKSALRLTMARYFTPLDRNIQARGIEPDIVVNQRQAIGQEKDGGFTVREADLEGHLENTSQEGKAEESGVTKTRPPFIADDDFQYNQALLVLKALGITAGK